VTKICESFASGFARVRRTLDCPPQPVEDVLRMQKSGDVVELYGRFGPEYKQFGSLWAIYAFMQMAQGRINTGYFACC
jgi:hypothetical protein